MLVSEGSQWSHQQWIYAPGLLQQGSVDMQGCYVSKWGEPVESPAVNLCSWAPFRKGSVDVQGCYVGKQERASGVTSGESMH